jgi:hypothetical protein
METLTVTNAPVNRPVHSHCHRIRSPTLLPPSSPPPRQPPYRRVYEQTSEILRRCSMKDLLILGGFVVLARCRGGDQGGDGVVVGRGDSCGDCTANGERRACDILLAVDATSVSSVPCRVRYSLLFRPGYLARFRKPKSRHLSLRLEHLQLLFQLPTSLHRSN